MRMARHITVFAALLLVPLLASAQVTRGSAPSTVPTPTALGGQQSLGVFPSSSVLFGSFPAQNQNIGTMAYTGDLGELVVASVSGTNTWVQLGGGGGGTAGNPTASVGTTTVNGAALTFMRSDAAPSINLMMSPTWLGVHTFSQTIVGNINTASALAATPTNCGAGVASTGVAANGNAVGCFTPSGSGNVSATGSPASGNLAKFSGATNITNGDLSGDCTTSGTLAITCTKTSGQSYGTFAFQNYATPPAIGGTTPAAVSATTLSASGAVSGAGFASFTQTIASGTAALGTSAISSGACASVVTVAGSGIATTDTITWTFNADPTSTVGYQPSANGMLTIIVYPTSGNFNAKACNNSASSITPGAVTLNWRVVR